MGESYRPMRKLKRSGGQVAQRISASPRAARRARVHRRDPRKSSSDAAASASRGVARVERPAKPAVCRALRPAGMRGRAAHPAPRAATQQAPSPASARPRTYIDARRFLILQSRYARCARFVRVASCLGPHPARREVSTACFASVVSSACQTVSAGFVTASAPPWAHRDVRDEEAMTGASERRTSELAPATREKRRLRRPLEDGVVLRAVLHLRRASTRRQPPRDLGERPTALLVCAR